MEISHLELSSLLLLDAERRPDVLVDDLCGQIALDYFEVSRRRVRVFHTKHSTGALAADGYPEDSQHKK